MNMSSYRRHRSTSEWLIELGASIRLRRIQAEMTQDDLARLAGISGVALKHLETGSGANLASLVKVVRALGCEDWLASLTPPLSPAVSPLQLLREQQRTGQGRRRVRKRHI